MGRTLDEDVIPQSIEAFLHSLTLLEQREGMIERLMNARRTSDHRCDG
ncbi:MAG: hypothetical protein SV375_19790 [Thermodesulfobacteriota bacterium]|nr:hypothetical protein [Thermodesulfobacteriota bacterium]